LCHVVHCICQYALRLPAGCANIQGAVPEWAHTGNFSFARWDGGPIEVSKGILSGWPGFLVPDPQVIYATENLYDVGTIELIERAHDGLDRRFVGIFVNQAVTRV
jgi:hypothetical protein